MYVHSGGKIDSKQPYLAMLASGSLDYVSQKYDPPARVVVANADAAFVTGRVTSAAFTVRATGSSGAG